MPHHAARPDRIAAQAREVVRSLARPIVIVGMMGVGKSTVGPRLAALLGVGFVDTDREIVAAAGCTVNEIFARDGEAKFREVEKAVLRRLLKGGLSVIATGGGAPMDPETARLIFGQSVSVWIRAERDDLVARLAEDTTRPLLQTGEDIGAVVDRILAERESVYARADITATWRDANPVRMTRSIVGKLHAFVCR